MACSTDYKHEAYIEDGGRGPIQDAAKIIPYIYIYKSELSRNCHPPPPFLGTILRLKYGNEQLNKHTTLPARIVRV